MKRGVVDVLVLVAVLVGVPVGLTGVSIHRYTVNCHTQGGVVHTSTWHGVPAVSTCVPGGAR